MIENGAHESEECLDIDMTAPIPLWGRILMFFMPIVVFWLVTLAIYLFLGWRPFSFFFANAVGNFIGAGKLVILTGALPEAAVGVWGLAALVVYSDIAVSLMLLATMHMLYKLPFVGTLFSKSRRTGCQILRNYPWIRRSAFFGVAVYIGLPFQGTGAVLGTIIARMTGLSRRATIGAVLVGSGLGCSAIAWMAEANRERLALLVEHPQLGLIFAAMLFAVMFIVGKRLTDGAPSGKNQTGLEHRSS